MTYDYRVFGLRVRSSVELPELLPARDAAAPDVVIELGPVTESPQTQSGLTNVGGALILVVPNVARYRIRAGVSITIAPCEGVPERNLRLFLLGSAFGALLHQRGLLPLHANAIEIDGKAVAYMGEPGAGKSTLAAWFHDRGHRIIADDVCVVGFDDAGKAVAKPGLPRLRLWREALEASGHDPASYPRSYAGDERFDKFDVPIDSAKTVESDTPLAALYQLQRGEQASIDRRSGLEAAEAVFANTYRGAYLEVVGDHEAHWTSAVRLVGQVPVFRAARTWGSARLDDQCTMLLEHARKVCSGA
jgi:hypothetical protein